MMPHQYYLIYNLQELLNLCGIVRSSHVRSLKVKHILGVLCTVGGALVTGTENAFILLLVLVCVIWTIYLQMLVYTYYYSVHSYDIISPIMSAVKVVPDRPEL
jgi:hypothetical protein